MMLYIAGPMTGLPEFNHPAFEIARVDLMAAGYSVLSPTDNGRDREPGEYPWTWYMRAALRMLLDADAVAVLPDAACSRGAVLEVTVARALEMQVRPVAEWLERAGWKAVA